MWLILLSSLSHPSVEICLSGCTDLQNQTTKEANGKLSCFMIKVKQEERIR